MGYFLCMSRLAMILAMAIVMSRPASAQISTPCNASMINSVSPCMNFLTNSSNNGTSPTADCCNSLKSLTSSGMDCFCLIVTGSVPFRMPINRTLAISLPRACNMPGVPFQCKSTGSPLPAPGPASFGPSAAPAPHLTPSPSPQAPSILPTPSTPSEAPESDPTSPTVDSNTPPAAAGGRSALTPSSAILSYSVSPSLFLIPLGFALLKYY